jgi:hypothetical protein
MEIIDLTYSFCKYIIFAIVDHPALEQAGSFAPIHDFIRRKK